MRSLSPRFIRDLLHYFQADGLQIQKAIGNRAWQDAVDKLQAALKPKRSAAPAKKRRETKRKQHRDEMASIREAVWKRSDGFCENPSCGRPCDATGEADHFFGGVGRRRALQDTSTVWLLCGPCHRMKTANRPGPEAWLERFITHCDSVWRKVHKYGQPIAGYLNAQNMARARLESLAIMKSVGGLP